jgi:uncharacterized protein (TIGR00725 family)
MSPTAHNHRMRYNICVSGAAAGHTVEEDKKVAERLGTCIAKHGHVLTTGATVGLPFYAARGAKKAGGMSVGFSPATSIREHLRKYRLPSKYFDFINYTGMGYVGRDLYLVQSSDAIITVGGRFGTLHEFSSALESSMPCGILIGSDGAADVIPQLLEVLETPNRHLIIFDDNPERLVERVIAVLDKDYHDIKAQIERDEFWFLDSPDKPHQG